MSYWVFDENQLDKALKNYCAEQVKQGISINEMKTFHESTMQFVFSEQSANAGLIHGKKET